MARASGISRLLARGAMCASAINSATNTARRSAKTTGGASSVGNQISLEKIDARVFCRGTEGGNPVTIFAASRRLPISLSRKLAKSCDWESVVVNTGDVSSSSSSSQQTVPTMAFFMPSGEEVSFCAHAAIGGAIAMGDEPSASQNFEASMTGDTFVIDTAGVAGDGTGSSSSGRSCCLHMNDVRFEEAPLSPIAGATLREWSDTLDWSWSYASCKDPSNASVARPKTLVELESVEAVQRAKPPPCGDGSFADACASMDDSTGVYLYAKLGSYSGSNDPGVVSYECRQFPRSSGYPEDPATGIAAAALAASLRFGQGTRPSSTNKSYNIYQGTAMGRPSLMQVLNLERDEASGELSFGLQGRVEIDNRSTIHVSE